MIPIAVMVLHYLELTELQSEHKVLYKLSQMLLLLNVIFALYNTHLSDQVKMRLLSQLIKGISRIPAKIT